MIVEDQTRTELTDLAVEITTVGSDTSSNPQPKVSTVLFTAFTEVVAELLLTVLIEIMS